MDPIDIHITQERYATLIRYEIFVEYLREILKKGGGADEQLSAISKHLKRCDELVQEGES